MPVINNKKYGKAVIKVVDSTETITLADLQLPGETVRGSHITEVYWTGPGSVTRNSIVVLKLTDGQDNWIFDGDFVLREGANSSYEIVATGGTVILEVDKITENEK